jgi:hypothetical protein
MQAVDILQTSVERLEVWVMLEATLDESFDVAARLDGEGKTIDVPPVIYPGNFAALLGCHGHEEGVPDGLESRAGIFHSDRGGSDGFHCH